MDVDARIQLFDLKKKYQFQTTPAVDQYNMPLYDVQVQPGSQSIGSYPVFQGFLNPVYVNQVPITFQTQKGLFFNNWNNGMQNLPAVAVADGSSTAYSFQLPILSNSAPVNPPVQGILRGHVDISGIIATGNNIDPPVNTTLDLTIPTTSVDSAVFITSTDSTGANVVIQDSGQFLTGNVNYGLLMRPGNAPLGNTGLNGGYSTTSNTINYLTGQVYVDFSPIVIPAGVNINVQCYYFSSGLPRTVLFYNNCLTFRSPPDRQYLVELDGYLTPAAYLNTADTVQFGYMCEYIARGAARKILADTGDVEQFNFYEPLFKEQEMLVWKRSQRIFTSTRTETLYSRGRNQGMNNGYNQYGLNL